MRKIIFIVLWITVCVSESMAQARVILPDSLQVTPRQAPHDHQHEMEEPFDTVNLVLPAATVWYLHPRSGDRLVAAMDTLKHNYQQTTIPDGYSVAGGYLGPIGSPFISKIFFEQDETSHFPFYDAYRPYNKSPEQHLFYNTRVPYANLTYQTAGSRPVKEQRLKALLTTNFGKRLNAGIEGDLISAKGLYRSQENKHNDWSLFGNYLSDKFESHLLASTSTVKQFENGGITDERFILDPESVGENFSTGDIPVKFTNTWNKMKTNHLFFSGKYNIGYNDRSADSLGSGKFVPVASLVITSHYTGQDRRFLSYDTAQVTIEGQAMQRIDQFYTNRYYNTAVDDSVTFSSFKNSVALSLREGFKPWVKFGLTGYIEHEVRNFSMIDSVGGNIGRSKHRENSLFIGGILNKQQGEHFRFNLQANLGMAGADLGEVNLEGEVETAFNLAGKRTELSGHAYLRNITPNYLQKHYHSKYFWWDKELEDVRRAFVGGRLHIPFTNTTVNAGVENLQNYIYFDQERTVAQHAPNVQVLTAGVDQNIRLGVFNWDNRVVYQTSSNQEVIPVPSLSVYSNMYLKALIVNELTFQFGVDAHYHTTYFSPGYEPALLQFYNQREKEIGNYPIATVYANMHLKQTRFFVMLYNAASAVLKPREYFSLPNYPVNPMMFKMGLSVDLHN
ncbi:putative porin [Petrimonas mucosa]|uniref:Putative membrane protein n=1 Tax=Petrimonas mucosa TaxID=1642646 RepID=A0A1G4G7H6_9BACT|nr:putative porin [Petrimonas mucosa]SCM57990.1 putative membrane protein {ECO:0000313/EMBL:CEA15578,1} [Petrimonas mucosa]